MAGAPLIRSSTPPDLLEFADYECPYCRAMSPAVDSATHAGARISFVQFPLPSHKHAARAALVALCAQDAGHFPEVHQYLMSSDAWQNDSVWTALPVIGPLLREPSFAECTTSARTKARLEQQRQLAVRLKLTGTPTLIAKQTQLARSASADELVKLAVH